MRAAAIAAAAASPAAVVRALAPHVHAARLARLRFALRHRVADTVLVFENVVDEHNVAACMRTADALGIQQVHVIERWADAFVTNSGVDKGTTRWLTVQHHKHADECFEALAAGGFRTFATDLGQGAVPVAEALRLAMQPPKRADGGSGECAYVPWTPDADAATELAEWKQDVATLDLKAISWGGAGAASLAAAAAASGAAGTPAAAGSSNTPASTARAPGVPQVASAWTSALAPPPQPPPGAVYRPRVALVFGNEHRGCSKATLQKADVRFFLPQRGFVQSMNISVAAAIASTLFVNRTPDYQPVSEGAYEIMQAPARATQPPVVPPRAAASAASDVSPLPFPPLAWPGMESTSPSAAALPLSFVTEGFSWQQRQEMLARWLVANVTAAERILTRAGVRPDDL